MIVLEVAAGIGDALEGLRVRWARLVDTEGPRGSLPDARRVVTHDDPDALSEHAVAKAYRELFWSFDVDPTKQRPAGEALARRVAQGKPFPEILPIVDAYNLASASTLVPFSAFALESLAPPVRLDLAEDGDTFEPIGGQTRELAAGRPVWRDRKGVVSLLAYRDAQRTVLDEHTEEALVVAVGPREAGPRVLPDAFRTLEQYASVVGWSLAGQPRGFQV